MLFLPFANSLLIICSVNQRPVSKSKLANLITVLSSTCFHYRCATSLILTSTVPRVTGVTIDIGQKRVRSFNDLVLLKILVFERPSVTGGPDYLVVSKSSDFNVNVSPGISLVLPSVSSKLFGYVRSCEVMILLFIGCFGFNW